MDKPKFGDRLAFAYRLGLARKSGMSLGEEGEMGPS